MKAKAVAFLTKIQAAPDGINGKALMEVVGVDVPRGLGGVLSGINGQIMAADFTPEDAYLRTRTRAGRLWKPGRKIDQVIEALTTDE